MSYTITKTDGSLLTEIVDGTFDQTATDLNLVGKNTSNYGQLFNENFVKLLENFANTSQPNYPIAGQLWYDTAQGRLKIYDGSSFKVAGGTIVSNSSPTLTQGDIWIDSYRQQLYFNDGSATHLAGPIYTAQQGISGFQSIDVLDDVGVNHTVVLLYVSQTLLGIFNKDAAFTPSKVIPGFGTITTTVNNLVTTISKPVGVGFTASDYSGLVFNLLATKASNLVAADGTSRSAESFLSAVGSSSTTGTITINNGTPLIFGPSQNNEFIVSNTLCTLTSNTLGQNFQIQTQNVGGQQPSVFINATNQYVGLNTNLPNATLDVNGNTVIRGNLDVKGTTTFLESTTMQIADKNIELGNVTSPTDTTADNGGIILHGATDKTFTWSNATQSWNSSDSINVAVGKSFNVNGFTVLTQTQLGPTVTSAPGLISVGNLTSLQAGYVNVTNSTIAYTNPASANGTLTLSAKGTGTVDVNSFKITSVGTPTTGTDATNKTYVDNKVSSAPLALGSIDTTGLTDSQIAANIINIMFPVAEHQNGTLCRLWTVQSGTTYKKLFTVVGGSWAFTQNL